MEKVRTWCGQPSDRGRLKIRSDQSTISKVAGSMLKSSDRLLLTPHILYTSQWTVTCSENWRILGGYEPTATTYGSSDSLQSTSLNDMLVGSAMQTWHSSWLWQHTHTYISTHKHIDHVRSTSNNRPHLSIPCMRCGRKNKNNIMGCLINRFSYA